MVQIARTSAETIPALANSLDAQAGSLYTQADSPDNQD